MTSAVGSLLRPTAYEDLVYLRAIAEIEWAPSRAEALVAGARVIGNELTASRVGPCDIDRLELRDLSGLDTMDPRADHGATWHATSG